MTISAEQVAGEILDTIPLIMRTIRSSVRPNGESGLSVGQFRVLLFVHHNPEASLSRAAEFMGLSLPTMSKLVDGLVARKMVVRGSCPGDRRRMVLELTDGGRAIMDEARCGARACLAKVLMGRTDTEREAIVAAMQVLRPAFTPGGKVGESAKRRNGDGKEGDDGKMAEGRGSETKGQESHE